MNNKDLPAFPVVFDTHFHRKGLMTNEDICKRIEGLTKRELIAATISIDQKEEILCFSNAAIKTILGRDLASDLLQKLKDFAELEAKIRVIKADALLTELSKSKNDLP